MGCVFTLWGLCKRYRFSRNGNYIGFGNEIIFIQYHKIHRNLSAEIILCIRLFCGKMVYESVFAVNNFCKHTGKLLQRNEGICDPVTDDLLQFSNRCTGGCGIRQKIIKKYHSVTRSVCMIPILIR